jgi:hypothetical protein
MGCNNGKWVALILNRVQWHVFIVWYFPTTRYVSVFIRHVFGHKLLDSDW